MNPGIYYLYEYKNNHRMRNTGFLKLTQKPAFWLLQIQSRNIPVTQQHRLELLAISSEEDSPVTEKRSHGTEMADHAISKKLSDLPCNHHSISAQLTIPHSGQESVPDVRKLHGFLIELPNGNWLAATEAQFHLNINEIIKPRIDEQVDDISESDTSEHGTNITENDTTEHGMNIRKSDMTESDTNISESDTTVLSASEYTEQVHEIPELFRKPDKEAIADTTDQQDFAPPSKTIRKIHRSDLKILPRKCWNLANNSFLLHGYHNYHHLLLIEENGHYQLGVPGVYDIREARAAEIFGFPQFIDSYNDQMELSAAECNTQEKFGYWCHYIY